jgi:YVTN family beta-propeller protein
VTPTRSHVVASSRRRWSSALATVVAASLLVGLAVITSTTPAVAQEGPAVYHITTGAEPLDVAVDPSTNLVYSANNYSNTVSVIDGSEYLDGRPNTGKVLATVPVGKHPWAIAVDQDTDRVYVANESSDNVSVINGHTDRVIAVVSVGVRPDAIGVVDATDTIYVANGGQPELASTVSVIDGRTDRVIAAVPIGLEPSGMAVNQVSKMVYVGDYRDYGTQTDVFVGYVSVIHGTNQVASVAIGLNNLPAYLAVDQLTNRVYASSSIFGESSGVVVINSSTNKALEEIDVPDPAGVAVDDATNTVYAAEGYDNDEGADLYIISGKLDEVSKVVYVSENPWGVAVDPSTDRVWIADDIDPGVVTMVDMGGYALPRPVPVPLTTIPPVPVYKAPPTTTPVTVPKTVPPSTTLPPQGTFCALLDKAGAASLGGGEELIVAENEPTSARFGVCYESNSLRTIDFERTNAEYAPGIAPYSVPSGLGGDAGAWVIAPPYNASAKVIYRLSPGVWVYLAMVFTNTETPRPVIVAAVQALITVARNLRSELLS